MNKLDNYFELYTFFNNPLIKLTRVLTFFVTGIFVYLLRENMRTLTLFMPFYAFLILQELFIFQKLNKIKPSQKVDDSSQNPEAFFDFHLKTLIKGKRVKEIIQRIEKDEEVKYFAHLLGTDNLPLEAPFDTEALFKMALELVKRIKGDYIHGIDIYASYLLLIDESEKILFNSGIKQEDVLVLLSWVRKEYSIDREKRFEIKFTGSGVFDFFVYGWSAELSRYAVNFTDQVLKENNTIPIGRDKEYDLLITALSKSSSSNALIIGDAGVGKTTLIKQFILDSNQGTLPHSVTNKIVFKLYPEKLLAGINSQGDLEERFTLLFEELLHAGNIIVFIPNIENIFGGGGINLDISGVLIEYLTSSKIKIIGSLTESSYQNYIYPKQELKQLFDIVKLDEPDSQTVLFMVMEKANELSRMEKIVIEYMAVKETVKLSSSYLNDGTGMPGKAIRLLEDVIAYAKTHGVKKITKEDVRNFVENKIHIVLDKPNQEESNTLLNLEQEIHKRIVSQDEAVTAISDAMRRVRSGMKDEKKPIASFLFLGPTGVGKTETAKALAFTYFGDENAMIRVDMSEYQRQESIQRFLGLHQNEEYEETVLDQVLNKPFSLILMDELEKAHPQVIDLFLQVFDEGRLTDNRGRTVSFKDTIIIATSNAGSEFIREKHKKGIAASQMKDQLIEKILSTNIFKPELINRFDDVVVFNPLTIKDASNVAKLFLDEIKKELYTKQIEISYDNTVPEFIAERSFSIEFGARNVKRFIEQSIQNQLSKLILKDSDGSIRNFSIRVINNELVID